jgi:type I restriction enzyme S subunit
MSSSKWKRVKLGEVCDILTGFPFKSEKFNIKGQGIKLARGKNVSKRFLRWGDDTRWWSEITPEIEKYLLKKDDILIGMDGSLVGKNYVRVKEVELPLLLVQRVACIRAKNGTYQKFVYYQIANTNFENYVDLVKTGSAIPHISGGQLADYFIDFPSLPEQQSIAATLSCLDDMIELNNRTNQLLDEIAQAIFKHWFVDFEFPNEDGEPYKASGGKMIESELGDIPQGWKVDVIGNCASVVTRGITPKYDNESNQYVINQKCIRDGLLNTVLARRHSSKVNEEKRVRFGDILINSTGVGTLGRVTQVYEELNNYTVDSHVTIVRPDVAYGIGYMGCLLKNMQSIFEHIATGSTGQTELGRESIRQIKILIPDNRTIDKYSKIYDSVSFYITSCGKENKILHSIRDTLLPKLMSGEIVVPVEEVG